MKTNEEIRQESAQMRRAGEIAVSEGTGPVKPEIVARLPEVTFRSHPSLNDDSTAVATVTRRRWIETTLSDQFQLGFVLMEQDFIHGAPSDSFRKSEPLEVMVDADAYAVLRAGYVMTEEDSLFAELAALSERVESRDVNEPPEIELVDRVEDIVGLAKLNPAERLRTRADIGSFLDGSLEAGVLISNVIERHASIERPKIQETRRQALRITLDEDQP